MLIFITFTYCIFALDDAKKFRTQVQDAILRRQKSVFSERTDDASAEQYFQVGILDHHTKS